MKKDISIAFLGALVPDEPAYHNPAFRRSGILVQDGIVNGLGIQKAKVTVFSLRPVPSFPKERKIFFKKKEISYKKIEKIILHPFINILIVKTITHAISLFFELIKWSFSNRKNNKYIIVYNTYTPPLPFVYWMGKITGSKTVAILYDLGMPPKQLNYRLHKVIIYRFVEFFAKRYIPRLDGRIVINENIANDYAKEKHSLLIDGGISESIIERLFSLDSKEFERENTKFLIAGTLASINGTKLIRETLNINSNPNIKIIFAGNGRDEEYVRQLTKEDKRVEYRGMLNLDELFKLYEEVDVLMNLRISSDDDKYLFPSKVLEYLVIGKYVLTTSVGHIEREYGHLCTVLEDNTPECLSNKINEIASMSNSELINKGQQSREFLIEHSTWDKQSMKIYTYLENLIK